MHVLVVAGDTSVGESLAHNLRRQGYETRNVGTAQEALATYPAADLVLTDLELPDLDGLEVCRSIRAASETPIIAVSSRGTELDCVLGLRAGADDYVVRPYGFQELAARIEAVMRRARPAQPADKTVFYGPLEIDPGAREIRLDGDVVNVTRKEFDLLLLLVSKPDTVVSRREIMSKVWDDNWSRSGRTIDTHVSSLRNKLGSASWIVTVRGVGFRIGRP
ncbi:response regulator transcription factor [Streptomyces sp. URMC 126]|uniref:response regulator transcription factor n=1 Tax=Streptomyces sp. URMC 126 TaxID=3423401 RepID=UPI003F1A4B68